MHGGGAGEPFDGAVQRLDTPFPDLARVDVERRLVELDDVDAVGGKRVRLAIEQAGKGHDHLHPIAVVGVGNGVDDGHRARQGEFEPAPGVGAGDLRLARMRAAVQPELAGHRRHHRLVAVGPDPDLHLAREIDAVNEFQKPVHEMLARLLAVGDDVDAAILLQLEREHGRIALGFVERAPASRHGAHSRLGSASQAGLGRLPAMVVSNIGTALSFAAAQAGFQP